MDRLTGQNNGFEFVETEKKSGKWQREVLKSRTTRQRLLSLCPATFLQLHFSLMFMIFQILTSVKEITLVT